MLNWTSTKDRKRHCWNYCHTGSSTHQKKTKIIGKDNLRLAFKRAAKGKTKRKDIARILADLDTHVNILHEILKNEEFQPAKHKKQQINDGFKQKKRYIIKPYYRYEQVVHHAIIQVLPQLLLLLNCHSFTLKKAKQKEFAAT